MARKPEIPVSEERLVPAGKARAEIEIERSRFIASLAPVSSVEEARSFVKEISQSYPDASHHVPAFIIGHGQSVITHASDAGEPAGTAGQPALRALEGSGLGNVAVVVTRYFGGIKLGTGGLARAYTEAVKSVLQVTKKARLVHTIDLCLIMPYGFFEQILKLASKHEGVELEKEFTEEVTLTIRVQKTKLEAFDRDLQELTRGQVVPNVVGENLETIISIL
ncbi:MAG TPA: YigZ family protein [Anaerolineaceae bacterium]|nr:YigZ family protein [Anaerolineaceae bacterium]